MSTVQYGQGHYQSYRSAALDKTINDSRARAGMIGEDTYGVYDPAINFDYVIRFLMSKYPDFIPIPGTDRRAGVLYADDMGLSVELQPYTDVWVEAYIDTKDILFSPKWEYKGLHRVTGWNHPTNPYEEVSGTTPRKVWRVSKHDSRHVTANEFMEQLEEAVPMSDKSGVLLSRDSLDLYPSVSLQAGVLYPTDMKKVVTTHWVAFKSAIHPNYEPKSWWVDDWNKHPVDHTCVSRTLSNTYCTDDGAEIYRLGFHTHSITTAAAGPVWVVGTGSGWNWFANIYRGWEDWEFWFHAPRYVYPVELDKYRYRPAGMNNWQMPLIGKYAEGVWVEGLFALFSNSRILNAYNNKTRTYPSNPYYSITETEYHYHGDGQPAGNYNPPWNNETGGSIVLLSDGAKEALARRAKSHPGSCWCLKSISFRAARVSRSKWVPRTTPVVDTDILTRNKRLVVERLVKAAEYMGIKTEKGAYVIEIDGQEFALPKTYARKEEEPKVYFSITSSIASKESKTSWRSTNWCPQPETTTTSMAIGDLCSFTEDSSPEEIVQAFVDFLHDLYVIRNGTGQPTLNSMVDGDWINRNILKEPRVATTIKLSSVGNTEHFTIQGTYKDGDGFKGAQRWWKESPFVAYVTVVRGEVPGDYERDT